MKCLSGLWSRSQGHAVKGVQGGGENSMVCARNAGLDPGAWVLPCPCTEESEPPATILASETTSLKWGIWLNDFKGPFMPKHCDSKQHPHLALFFPDTLTGSSPSGVGQSGLLPEEFLCVMCQMSVVLVTCYAFSSSHVQMWELDHKEVWEPKNWCFRIVVLEKTLESPLDCKEIKPVHPKGNQPWIFIGRTDAETEAPKLWLSDVKSQLTGKDPDARKDWGQEEKGATEDEMVGWHHWLNGHNSEQTLGYSEGQGSLVCCSPWDCTELDTTEQMNNDDDNNWSPEAITGHSKETNAPWKGTEVLLIWGCGKPGFHWKILGLVFPV